MRRMDITGTRTNPRIGKIKISISPSTAAVLCQLHGKLKSKLGLKYHKISGFSEEMYDQ